MPCAGCLFRIGKNITLGLDGMYVCLITAFSANPTASAFCHFFPFEGRQIVDVSVMQGSRHAILDTFRFARTQITLCGYPPLSFKMDAPEGAGMDTHSASHTGRLIHNHGPGFRIPLNGCCGADLQAQGRFALLTGHGKN
jgi:hypothetical protein